MAVSAVEEIYTIIQASKKKGIDGSWDLGIAAWLDLPSHNDK